MPKSYKLGKKMAAEMTRRFKNEDFKGAIEIFNEAVRIDPNIPAAGYLIPGLAYTALKDYDNAIYALRKAVASEVRNEIALISLGICYLEKDNPDPDAAIIVLDSALKMNPNEGEIYYRLSKAYRMKKDWKMAAEMNQRFKRFL